MSKISTNRVIVYTAPGCPFSTAAKRLLDSGGVPYREISLSLNDEGRSELTQRTGRRTFPQVLVDGATIGGYRELVAYAAGERLGAHARAA